MYRITSILFFKLFWIVEKFIFFMPTAPIKIWLGLWIMLPNFSVNIYQFPLIKGFVGRVLHVQSPQ
jgi:hypothetical protein